MRNTGEIRPRWSPVASATAAHYSRAYLHHLFAADEMLGPTLLSLHNIAFYLRLMRQARAAIVAGEYGEFARKTLHELKGT